VKKKPSEGRPERGSKPRKGRAASRRRANVSQLGDVANRLLFENERVKVWQMDLAPGESSDFHEHTHPYLICVVEGDTVDADFENGKSIKIPVRPGQVFYVEPGSRETAVNRSQTRFKEFLIELKSD
jgi:quercetin dioxygenase-like cupin family protein